MLIELGLLILTNTITAVVCLLTLFAARVPMKIRLSLVLTIVSLALWQTFVYVSNVTQTNVLFWNHFVFVWPGLATLAFFLFMHQLNEHHRWHLSKGGAYLQLVPLIILTLGILLQAFSISTGAIFVETPAGLVRGLGYVVYVVGLIMSLAAVIAYTVISYRFSLRHPTRSAAVKTVFYTVLAAIVYGLIANVVLPVVSGSQQYAVLGILTVDIFAIGFMLSVMRSGLMNFKIYVVRGIAYALSLTTLALVYGVLAFLVSRLFLTSLDSPAELLVNVSLALLLAFIFQPIKRFFDHVTNRLFYRDQYTSEAFFAGLNQILGTTSSLRYLLEKVSDYVAQALKAEHAGFFIYQDETHHITAGTRHYRKLPSADAQALTVYAIKHDYELMVTQDITDHAIKRLLMSHRIEVLLPLERSGDILGYFMLGEHRSGGYSYRDKRVLRAIDDELVIAVQNALSVQEIRDLNANLEQRIERATKELRASNAQLQRLDEAKDEFISMASHQLRTPLTSIKGYISMLMEGDVGPVSNEQKHLLREAFISSERMVRLISDFLNVSRLQTGKFVIDRRPVDLARLVKHELESLEPSAAARGLKFSYKPPKSLPKLTIDENKIQQVVMNFSDNALYYSKEKTVIKVSLKKVGDTIEFRVMDKGIGVPKAQQSHLFNKFFRATNARQQRPDGTGVGLFLAKKVIDAHGGEIIFESVEGKGSTFGFRLPIT
mgnify:CR=1 FL=1